MVPILTISAAKVPDEMMDMDPATSSATKQLVSGNHGMSQTKQHESGPLPTGPPTCSLRSRKSALDQPDTAVKGPASQSKAKVKPASQKYCLLAKDVPEDAHGVQVCLTNLFLDLTLT
jgi:hypothetical protein